MFEYIGRLAPHQTQKTTSLNQARRIIVTISPAISNINTIIEAIFYHIKTFSLYILANFQNNITASQNQKAELNNPDIINNIEKLKETLMIPDYYYEKSKPLLKPRTVCHSCSHSIKDKNEVPMRIYPEPCHAECYLENIDPGCLNDARLQHCWAMDANFNCKVLCYTVN